VTPADDLETLHRILLDRWNQCDAGGYGALFADDGTMVGFDGTPVESPAAIVEHLRGIFADHRTGTYVAKVREVRPLGAGTALLRAVAGLVPPGGSDVNPGANAVQVLVAVLDADGAWRVAHFQNTPAAFHGRPDAADALTAELQAVLAGDSMRPERP
jgi:uncharacterized protein (TIGR02246 family)